MLKSNTCQKQLICRSINDNYLRKVPTFIRTYKMYSFKSTAWKEMKGLKPHLFEGQDTKQFTTLLGNSAYDACKQPERGALLIQHLKESFTVADYMNNHPILDIAANIFPILFQVYFALYVFDSQIKCISIKYGIT